VPIGGIKLSDSPACQWTAQLPDECRTGADSLVCYPKFDEALLNEQCPTFPNDPVCQRHNSGTLVLQPNDLPGLRIPTPVESDSSASLASLIGDAAARAPTNTDQTTALPADSSLTDWTTSAYGGLCRSGQVCGK